MKDYTLIEFIPKITYIKADNGFEADDIMKKHIAENNIQHKFIELEKGIIKKEDIKNIVINYK